MSEELVRAVVEAREKARHLKALKDDSYTEWENTNTFLIVGLREAMEAQTRAEEALREAGLKEYEASKDSEGNGNKQPFPGVGIRVRERVVYDKGEALLWAIDHKIALLLDSRVFEHLMKASPGLPDFVDIQEEVTATIATDLGKVLEGVGE